MEWIAPGVRRYDNVVLGNSCRVEDFVVLGIPPRDTEDGQLETRIGDHCLIRTHTVIYAGNQIGNGFSTGHGALIRELNSIGNDVSIGSHTIIEHHVSIGHRVRIHSNAFVPEHCVIEDDAWLGPNVVLTNAVHPRCPNIPNCLEGVTIRFGAKVGANATLLPGITVGKRALVAAGSVVVEDVPDGIVVAGNPARRIKSVDELICPWDQTTLPYAE